MKTILYVDGRNFLGRLESVFVAEKLTTPSWATYNFRGLLDKVLGEFKRDEEIFYFAKIKEHPDSIQKSQQLIKERRELKAHLEQQKFKVVLSGNVRGNYVKNASNKNVLVFKEKGVDVGIAVDIAVAACDKKIKTAIIGSSDSDLQPAISELNKRKVESIYLGFGLSPNKGLSATTKQTILIRNSEVVEFAENVFRKLQ